MTTPGWMYLREIAVWIPSILATLAVPFLLAAFTQNLELILGPTEAGILVPLAIFPGPVALTWILSEFLGERTSLWGFFFHFLAALQFPIYVGIANAILVLGFPRSPVVQLLLSPLLIHMGWMMLLLILIFLSRLGL